MSETLRAILVLGMRWHSSANESARVDGFAATGLNRCAGNEMAKFKTAIFTATTAIAMLLSSCSHQPANAPQSAYPVAVDPSKVGNYPALTKSGGGYVYDEVLEYRVWINADGDDYYYAFATYENAKDFSEKTERAEEPLVLVLQHEHINEPEPGKYEHVTGDRIAEWRVEWLEGNKRRSDTIASFLREKAKESAKQSPGGDSLKAAPQE